MSLTSEETAPVDESNKIKKRVRDLIKESSRRTWKGNSDDWAFLKRKRFQERYLIWRNCFFGRQFGVSRMGVRDLPMMEQPAGNGEERTKPGLLPKNELGDVETASEIPRQKQKGKSPRRPEGRQKERSGKKKKQITAGGPSTGLHHARSGALRRHRKSPLIQNHPWCSLAPAEQETGNASASSGRV